MAASPDDSLLAKALLCAISVAKADRIQNNAATCRVRREINVSVVTCPFFAN